LLSLALNPTTHFFLLGAQSLEVREDNQIEEYGPFTESIQILKRYLLQELNRMDLIPPMELMSFLHLSNNSSIYAKKPRDVACLEGRRFGVLEYDTETPFSP
jgi:hypothetical protein